MLFNGIVLHKEQIHERLWRLAIVTLSPPLSTPSAGSDIAGDSLKKHHRPTQ